MSIARIVALALASAALLFTVQPASACPFCTAISQTFTEEMESMDAVVIARLAEPPANPHGDEVPKGKFQIAEVLKGASLLKDKRTVETIYFGEASSGSNFLIMGVDEPPELMWSTPLKLTPRATEYIKKLPSLPAEGAQRLRFFQQYLEDEDELLTRDAYDEFARSPYDVVKELEPYMDRDQLVEWIKNPDVPATRRRLYFTLLGVCGGEDDLPMLEEMLKSDDRQVKAGLDAMIGCYLTLSGADGLPLIEELFLENENADYADTYAAIMALRFHGTEGGVIPRDRVVQSLHYLLDRPQLADLVIPDLARWEDWSQIEKMVELFKTADEESSWVRVPVVNYLRACPKPEADEYLKQLEEIDPGAVKRANTFFPTGAPPSSGDDAKTSSVSSEATDLASAVENPKQHADQSADAADAGHSQMADARQRSLSRVPYDPAAAAVGSVPSSIPNRLMVVGVIWIVGMILMLIQWSILGGVGSSSTA